MRTEQQLRDALRGAAIGSPLDPRPIVRASARRHRGRQVAVGGVTTLAVVGIGAGSIAGIRTLLPHAVVGAASSSVAPQQDAASGGAPVAPGSKRAPADRINLCGGPLAEVAPAESGLVLTPNFPASASSTAATIDGTVTLTNTGAERVTGTTAASPALTLSQGGTVLWHSNGAMIMLAVVVDLAPGESMTYQASVTPVRCGVEDDLDGFRADLPGIGAGEYGISAAIDLTRTDASSAFVSNDLITGPLTAIRLG
jgi:hypothetical protein